MSTSHKDHSIRAEKLAMTSFNDLPGILEALKPLEENYFERPNDFSALAANERTRGYNQCVYDICQDINYLLKEYKKFKEEEVIKDGQQEKACCKSKRKEKTKC